MRGQHSAQDESQCQRCLLDRVVRISTNRKGEANQRVTRRGRRNRCEQTPTLSSSMQHASSTAHARNRIDQHRETRCDAWKESCDGMNRQRRRSRLQAAGGGHER